MIKISELARVIYLLQELDAAEQEAKRNSPYFAYSIVNASKVKVTDKEKEAGEKLWKYMETLSEDSLHELEMYVLIGREKTRANNKCYEYEELPDIEDLEAWRSFLGVDLKDSKSTIDFIFYKPMYIYINAYLSEIDNFLLNVSIYSEILDIRSNGGAYVC